jgi:hypothetical protein
VETLASWVVGDDGPGAALDEELPEGIAIVGGVGGAQACRRQRVEQDASDGRIAALAGGYFKREGTAATIDNSMDFCRSPAARAADRLVVGPPFPPAAERCALAVVLSII